MSAALEEVITAVLDTLDFDLVEVKSGGSRSRPTLDVRIDRRDGAKVTVDDCACASRALEARFDSDGQLGAQYVLEVSSPGVERPLRTAREWQRFVGRKASVVSPALHGRAEVDILGVDGDAGAEVLRLRTTRGEEQRVPLADVKEARLAFTW